MTIDATTTRAINDAAAGFPTALSMARAGQHPSGFPGLFNKTSWIAAYYLNFRRRVEDLRGIAIAAGAGDSEFTTARDAAVPVPTEVTAAIVAPATAVDTAKQLAKLDPQTWSSAFDSPADRSVAATARGNQPG